MLALLLTTVESASEPAAQAVLDRGIATLWAAYCSSYRPYKYLFVHTQIAFGGRDKKPNRLDK